MTPITSPMTVLPESIFPGGEKDTKAVCDGMTKVFLYQLLKVMRETIPDSGSFPGRTGKSAYTTLFDLELAESLSFSRIGLSESLARIAENRNTSCTDTDQKTTFSVTG